MKMLKILVADSTTEFGAAVAEAFEGRYLVSVCHDGVAALEAVRRERPDVLWLDLMLPGMDGFMILQAITMAGFHPKIIACSRYITDYVPETLICYGVCCLLRKPCSLSASLARIDDVARKMKNDGNDFPADPEELVYEALLPLGLTGKRAGHSCLQTAICLKMLDPDLQVTKTLYPGVAARCGGTAKRVERAIRCVLTDTWIVRDVPLWNFFFPEYTDRCPSNGVFIDRIADCVRERWKKLLEESGEKSD